MLDHVCNAELSFSDLELGSDGTPRKSTQHCITLNAEGEFGDASLLSQLNDSVAKSQRRSVQAELLLLRRENEILRLGVADSSVVASIQTLQDLSKTLQARAYRVLLALTQRSRRRTRCCARNCSGWSASSSSGTSWRRGGRCARLATQALESQRLQEAVLQRQHAEAAERQHAAQLALEITMLKVRLLACTPGAEWWRRRRSSSSASRFAC